MKNVFMLILLVGVLITQGCSYIFPSAIDSKPAVTELSEKKTIKDPPASQKKRTITIKINRNKEIKEESK